MSTSSTISPATSQQSAGSAQLSSMNLSALSANPTASKSKVKWPESVDIRLDTKHWGTSKFAIKYFDAQAGKWKWLERGQTTLSRAQIGNKEAFPTLHILDILTRKWSIVPGNATREGAYGSNVKLDIRTNGSRVIKLAGNPQHMSEPVTISLLPKFSSELPKPRPPKAPLPSSKPKPIAGNNKDDRRSGDVFDVTYKKDGKGNVIIEGRTRAEALLIYDEQAKRWVYMKDGTKDDRDGKNDGIINFRIIVKDGHTVSLYSTKQDAWGNTVSNDRLATLYTTKKPKRDKSDGAVVLGAAAGGIAVGGAGAGAGGFNMGKGGAATIGGAVALGNSRNPPKSNPKKPEKPTALELITGALSPVQEMISRSTSFESAVSELSSNSSLSRALSDRDGVDVNRTTRHPSAAETARMQADVVTFSKTAGPVLLQLLGALAASAAVAALASLIGTVARGKVLNGGRPAMISIFGYNPLAKGAIGPHNAAAGLGPYFGVSAADTTVSNTNFNLSFATPSKMNVGGRDIGLGITLSWAIDTAEENDLGWVGDQASFVVGAFGYALGGNATPPPLNPPQDRARNKKKFYIGLEHDAGVQVRYRPGREHGKFILAGWGNLLLTVASNKHKNAPVLLVGPSYSPPQLQKVLDPKPNDPPPKPKPKPAPSRELTAVVSGFDNKFWAKREMRNGKPVHDLLKAVTLLNTESKKRHYVRDGQRPVKGQKPPGLNYDYDSGSGKRNPLGVKMKYNGGKNGLQHPNEVIFHLGNGMKVHVQFDNLWKTKARSGAEPKLKKIYIHYGPNQKLTVDQDWVNKNLTATFKNGKVTLINKTGANAPT